MTFPDCRAHGFEVPGPSHAKGKFVVLLLSYYLTSLFTDSSRRFWLAERGTTDKLVETLNPKP